MHLHRHRGCPTMTTRTSKAKHTNRCMSPTKFTLVAFVACTLLFTASQQFMLIMPPPSNLRIVPKDIDGTVGSQADNNVDKLISHKLFKKDFAGTFVEFGCSNGIRNSNSLLLEREYGWNGLCIEPNPFEAKFAIKNRKHGIHALISYPAQDYKYAAMSGHCAQGSGIVEFMNEKSKNNLKTCPKARGEQLNYVTIPGVNLETLLDENHMPSVTWISADCEGCEWTFIQNFDFDKYDVRVFSYETSANQATRTKIEHLLTEKGFSKHNWKGNDVVYVRNMHRNTPQNTPISVDEPDQEMPLASNLRIVPKNIDGTVGSQADRNSPALGKTISYSLYGSNPRYTDGAIDNAKLMKEIYPDIKTDLNSHMVKNTHISSKNNIRKEKAKYVLYTGGERGQGLGNIMNGLIVAHMLGRMYERTVCVIWPSFNRYFQEKDPYCDSVRVLPTHNMPKALSWNFGNTMDPQKNREIFKSDNKYILFDGNEWIEPNWPKIPKNVWSSSYIIKEPTLIPHKFPCVAHLRNPDPSGDNRKRMTADIVTKLTKLFPKCHLITNNVNLFNVVKKLGWSHPSWNEVTHSASGPNEHQDFIMWSDWLTILNADFVIHTPSGFSESALRLSPNAESRRFEVGSNGEFVFSLETWIKYYFW